MSKKREKATKEKSPRGRTSMARGGLVDALAKIRGKAAEPEAPPKPEATALVVLSPLRRASVNAPDEGTDGLFFGSPKQANVVFGVRCLGIAGAIQPRVLTARARLYWDGVEAASVHVAARPLAAPTLFQLESHVEEIDHEVSWQAPTEPPDGAAVFMEVSGSMIVVPYSSESLSPMEVPFRGKCFLRVTRAHS